MFSRFSTKTEYKNTLEIFHNKLIATTIPTIKEENRLNKGHSELIGSSFDLGVRSAELGIG